MCGVGDQASHATAVQHPSKSRRGLNPKACKPPSSIPMISSVHLGCDSLSAYHEQDHEDDDEDGDESDDIRSCVILSRSRHFRRVVDAHNPVLEVLRGPGPAA